MRYCQNCDLKVQPESPIDWIIFVILTLLTLVGGVLYLVWTLNTQQEETCPVCGAANWGNARTSSDTSADSVNRPTRSEGN